MTGTSGKRLSTRDRIVEAGTELIWRDGYNAVSVDVMCAAATVQKGSFYHFFPSKAALLVEALTRVRDADLSEMENIYAADDPLHVKFRNHLEWFGIAQRRLTAKYGFVPGTFNMVLDVNVPDEAKSIVRAGLDHHLKLLESTVGGLLHPLGVQPGTAAWLASVVMDVIHGVVIGARLNNSLAGFDTLPESVFAVLGLSAPPRASRSREFHSLEPNTWSRTSTRLAPTMPA